MLNFVHFSKICWTLIICSLVLLPSINPTCSDRICLCRYTLIRLFRICNITLLPCRIRAIVRLLEHNFASPFLCKGMSTNLHHTVGYLKLCHITLQSCYTTLISFSPRAYFNSASISSLPLHFFIAFNASLTSSSKMFGLSTPITWTVETNWFTAGVPLA